MKEGSRAWLDLALVPGEPIVPGSGSGELLCADVGLSFWGGVDPVSGAVIDRRQLPIDDPGDLCSAARASRAGCWRSPTGVARARAAR